MTLRPASAGVRHVVTFVHVDEAAFVGGGMRPLDSDVGLWVTGDGVVEAVGTAKTPWTRLAGAAEVGAAALEVVDATGWRPGDELVVVPTAAPTVGRESWEGYDTRRVESVDGRTVTLDGPLQFSHPVVAGKWTAEVLNLTRNVRIRGTAEGRAHTLFMTDRPQTLSHVELRHMGPRTVGGDDPTNGVLGRYPLHFHHCGDGSRGTVVENVVVHECGNRAFVPHASHGITLRGCVSHDTWEDAYWWDPGDGNQTHDSLWEGCVASHVRDDPPFRGYRLTGFNLRHGERNVIVGCVAVGVQGNTDASGFLWPEKSGSVWEFRDNLAHNNKRDGLFIWQNSRQRHEVGPFTSYHNADNGLEHGAYTNAYAFRDGVLYGNGRAGVQVHAASRGDGQLKFERLEIDGGGVSQYGMEFVKHTLPPGQPHWVEQCVFRGSTDAAVAFTYDGRPDKTHPEWAEFVACRFEGDAPAFHLSDGILKESLITVEPEDAAPFQLRRADRPGEPAPEWNAARTALPNPSEPVGTVALAEPIEERFEEAVEGAWGGGWTVDEVSGTPPRIYAEKGGAVVRSAGSSGTVALSPTAEPAGNVDQRVTFRINTNLPRAGLFARYDADAGTGLGVRVGTGSSRPLELFRLAGGRDHRIAESSNVLGVAPDRDYRLRLVVRDRGRGVELKAKLWRADEDEPEDWTLSADGVTDRALRGTAGRFGVWVDQRGSKSRIVRFDDYEAAAP